MPDQNSLCLICGRPVPDYEPKYCCSGFECGCQGDPIEPCCCSRECENAVYSYIGRTFEDRRILAGIEKWSGVEDVLFKLRSVLGELPSEFESKPVSWLESASRLALAGLIEIDSGAMKLKISDDHSLSSLLEHASDVVRVGLSKAGLP